MPEFPKPYRPNTFRHPLSPSQVQSVNDTVNDIYRHLKYLRDFADALEAAQDDGTVTPALHDLLGTRHGDTNPHTPVEGDLIVGNNDPAWEALAVGDEDDVLQVSGGVPTWTPADSVGHWQVVTNGDPDNPEVVFDGDGDITEVWVS